MMFNVSGLLVILVMLLGWQQEHLLFPGLLLQLCCGLFCDVEILSSKNKVMKITIITNAANLVALAVSEDVLV